MDLLSLWFGKPVIVIEKSKADLARDRYIQAQLDAGERERLAREAKAKEKNIWDYECQGSYE